MTLKTVDGRDSSEGHIEDENRQALMSPPLVRVKRVRCCQLEFIRISFQ